MSEILTEIHGRKIGLDVSNNLVMPRRNGAVETVVYSADDMYKGVATVTVTSAQVLALNATPITIVAAPGANLAIVPTRVVIRHGGGTAYGGIATGEDLVLKYTNGSGAQCSGVIETTGFLDQTGAQIRTATGPASTGATAGDFAPVANAAVVLHLLVGEITTGNFPLIVRCYYDVIPTNFTA
jgi:hypothetical protein